MNLTEDIKEVLKQNNVLELSNLKKLTRKDLQDMQLDNNQINQVIIYLQLNGLDIKKNYKKSSKE